MTPIEVLPKLYLLKYDSQYSMTSTFIRLQEFYESPYDSIRGKHFTWEKFIDNYIDKGVLSYWNDWIGFNVPGNIIHKFFDIFSEELTTKETKLCSLIMPLVEKHNQDFYLIGVFQDKDINHEVAHGLFYLNKDYQKEMEDLINSYSTRHFNKLNKQLIVGGYPSQVILDEIQAYEIDKKNKKFLRIFNKYYTLDKK